MENKNNTLLLIIIGLLALALISVGIYIVLRLPVSKETTNDSTNTPVETNEKDTTTENVTTQVTNFSNNFMTIDIPKDWTYSEAADAINIEKSGYILYINPNFNQASGVNGARFSEISEGSPSADLVMLVQPNDPCGTKASKSIFLDYVRTDLYISKNNGSEACGAPTDNSTRWYFSYVTTGTGYVNYYDTSSPSTSYVITMSYQTDSINMLPNQDENNLEDMLNQMSDILKTLVLRK